MTISGGRTEQLDIFAGFLLRHWIYEWFSQFHSCETYLVLSRSPSTDILLHKVTYLFITAVWQANQSLFWSYYYSALAVVILMLLIKSTPRQFEDNFDSFQVTDVLWNTPLCVSFFEYRVKVTAAQRGTRFNVPSTHCGSFWEAPSLVI